jgi:hypothetical protein
MSGVVRSEALSSFSIAIARYEAIQVKQGRSVTDIELFLFAWIASYLAMTQDN